MSVELWNEASELLKEVCEFTGLSASDIVSYSLYAAFVDSFLDRLRAVEITYTDEDDLREAYLDIRADIRAAVLGAKGEEDEETTEY